MKSIYWVFKIELLSFTIWIIFR